MAAELPCFSGRAVTVLQSAELGVEAQQVSQRLAETRDGGEEVEGVVRAMPVVVVEEARES